MITQQQNTELKIFVYNLEKHTSQLTKNFLYPSEKMMSCLTKVTIITSSTSTLIINWGDLRHPQFKV